MTTLRIVDRVIRRDDDVKNTIVGTMMGDEWPIRRRFPEPHSCSRRTPEPQWYGTLSGRHRAGRIGGNTIGRLNDTTLFVGDLAYNGMHAYLADGYWRDWLALLTRLEREFPDDAVLHVGHGDPGTKSLLATQRRYVEAFVEAVRENAGAVTAGDQRAGGAGDASAPTNRGSLVFDGPEHRAAPCGASRRRRARRWERSVRELISRATACRHRGLLNDARCDVPGRDRSHRFGFHADRRARPAPYWNAGLIAP
jgi:glyoxylase-like metal-dependent hydrolase (beta-lactamase superfamily II)